MCIIRVLVADDHPVVRKGIMQMLSEASDICVVGEAASAAEAFALSEELAPDVLLLDMEFPGNKKGSDVVKQLNSIGSKVKILALSAYDDRAYIKQVLENGASGYLTKEEAPQNILEAIRGVARGEKGWLSREIAGKLTKWMTIDQRHGKTLTPREMEVLKLIVDGGTNQSIATALAISEKTVEKHLEIIYIKFGVSSRVEAAVYAVRRGLV